MDCFTALLAITTTYSGIARFPCDTTTFLFHRLRIEIVPPLRLETTGCRLFSLHVCRNQDVPGKENYSSYIEFTPMKCYLTHRGVTGLVPAPCPWRWKIVLTLAWKNMLKSEHFWKCTLEMYVPRVDFTIRHCWFMRCRRSCGMPRVCKHEFLGVRSSCMALMWHAADASNFVTVRSVSPAIRSTTLAAELPATSPMQ